jgi:hypothetical protein
MARSIALSSGFADASSGLADTYVRPGSFRNGSGRPASRARVRSMVARLADWLRKSHQRSVERDIESYLADRGFDHFTDSIERDIEYRFLSRQHDRL